MKNKIILNCHGKCSKTTNPENLMSVIDFFKLILSKNIGFWVEQNWVEMLQIDG